VGGEKSKVGMVGQMLVYLIGKPTSPANIVGLANDLKNVSGEKHSRLHNQRMNRSPRPG
jgi:hypothetical protein